MIRKYAEFFCWKNVSSFCSAKATHIFSAKNIRILYIESAKTVNEMTLNELVKLTTLWTTGPCLSDVSKNLSVMNRRLYVLQWAKQNNQDENINTERTVTGDIHSTWVHLYDPESKVQCCGYNSLSKIHKTKPSIGTVKAKIFSDTECFLLIDYLLYG